MSEDVLRTALLLAKALEERAVPYAIGGALAYGVWGIPRTTLDIDINVFVDEVSIGAVLDAVRSVGGEVDDDAAKAGAVAHGLIVARHGPFRLDLFISSIAFCDEAERTRVRVAVDGQEAWYLSAEAVSVFKMMFFRPKDILDLERLVAVRGTRLDVGYVRAQLVDMMGPEDARVVRWDALTKRTRTPAEEYEVETPLVLRGREAFAVLRKADGSLLDQELKPGLVGALRRGDRVRVSTTGDLEFIERASDSGRSR